MLRNGLAHDIGSLQSTTYEAKLVIITFTPVRN